MLFHHATAQQLGFARILVFGLLLGRLIADPVEQLADFPLDAFLPHGMLRWLPDAWLSALLTTGSLIVFKWSYAAILCLALFGVGPRLPVLCVAIIGTILHHGLARGFGGHVNHQELIVLHCALLLSFFPCFDGLSLNRVFSPRRPAEDAEEAFVIYRFAMRTLCFWIALTYFYIGVARLGTAGLSGFFTNALTYYAVLHSAKWNYWDFSFARDLPNQPWLQWLFAVSFPIATILELAAPLAVYVRRLTVPLVVSLWIFHLIILLFMNIFFWQQMILLSLFLIPFIRRSAPAEAPANRAPAIVFYDGTCGLCHRFVRWVARRDPSGRFQFASLNGATATAHGVVPTASRRGWTVLLKDEQRLYQRSAAIFRILAGLPAWTDVGKLLLGLPSRLADAGYMSVAAVRDNFFRRRDACPLPEPQWRERLLP